MLYYFFILLALIETFVLYLVYSSLSYWVAPLLVLGFFIAVNIFYLAFLYVASLFLSITLAFIPKAPEAKQENCWNLIGAHLWLHKKQKYLLW